MSKFETLLNSLFEDVAPTANVSTAPTTGSTVTSNPNPGTPATNQPSTFNQQQTPKPGTTPSPITDPNHPIVNALATAKTSQDVLNALKTNNIQLLPAAKT